MGKVVASVELVVSNHETIIFLEELSFIPDQELFMALISHRESGFPLEFSAEVLERMWAKNSKSRMHSWIRLFGVQSAWLDYSSRKYHKIEVKRSIARVIDHLIKAREDERFKDVSTVEPRLIFWLEDL